MTVAERDHLELADSAPKSRRLRKKTAVKAQLPRAEVLAIDMLGANWRDKIDSSHKLKITAATAYCRNCARFAESATRLRCLKRPCPADKEKHWVSEQLAALDKGIRPGKRRRTHRLENG